MDVNEYLQGLRKETVGILEAYRERNITDIDVKDYFKKKLKTLEAYEAWCKWKFKKTSIPDNLDHLTTKEKLQFISAEKDKLHNGIWIKDKNGVPLQVMTGTHYFFMNYCKIKVRKNVTNPDFRRKDGQIFDILESLYYYDLDEGKHRQGLGVGKRRRYGFTTLKAAFGLLRMILDPNWRAIGHSHDETMTKTYFYEWALMLERMPSWIIPKDDMGKELKNVKPSEMKISLRRWSDSRAQMSDDLSTFRLDTPVPKNFEGDTVDFYDGDEYGKIKHNIFLLFKQTVSCCADSTGVVKGLFMIGGTAGEMDKNGFRYRSLLKKPKNNGLFTLFIGAQHGRYVDPETGFDDEEKALNEIEAQVAEIQATGSPEALSDYYRRNPTNLDQCFYLTGSIGFDSVKINIRLQSVEYDLNNNVITVQRGIFGAPKNPKSLRPEWIPTPYGKWFILEHPDESVINQPTPQYNYIAGADNYDMRIDAERAMLLAYKDNVELSELVTLVGNTTEKRVIAWYANRAQNPKDDYLQSLYGAMYWNCKLLPEKNKSGQHDFFFDYETEFHSKGFYVRYLCRTPRKYGSSYRVQYGMNVGSNKYNLIGDYVVPYMNSEETLSLIDCVPLLEDVLQWDLGDKRSNADYGMAMLMLCIAWENYDSFARTEESENTNINIFEHYGLKKYVRGADGKITRGYK